MTVRELASRMNELFRDNRNNYQVFISLDGITSFPIKDILYRENTKLVILSHVERKGLRAPETAGFERLPIEDSDLERAQRATFNPDEEQKDQ